MLSKYIWENITHKNYCTVLTRTTYSSFRRKITIYNAVLNCLSQRCTRKLPVQCWPPYSTNNFAHKKFTMLPGSVWVNIAQGSNLWNVGLWLTDNFYEENKLYNVVSTMLGHIAQEYCLVIVVQIRLREHCTRKLLV